MERIRFVVWYDYLCPWCYNGAVRLERLRDEFQGRVELDWRCFLLRPAERGARDPQRFRAYTQSWLRPAQEPDSGEFRVWEGDAREEGVTGVPAVRLAGNDAIIVGAQPLELYRRWAQRALDGRIL